MKVHHRKYKWPACGQITVTLQSLTTFSFCLKLYAMVLGMLYTGMLYTVLAGQFIRVH